MLNIEQRWGGAFSRFGDILKTVLMISWLFVCLPAMAAQDEDAHHPTYNTIVAKPVMVADDQATLTINLSENATTGFRWWLKSAPAWLRPVSSSYQAPEGRLMGAPGMRTFQFQVDHRYLGGSTVPMVDELVFYYARSWENGGVKQSIIRVFKMPQQSHGVG